MANYRLVTFDAYTGLADFRATLVPVIERILALPADAAESFLTTWRANQLAGRRAVERAEAGTHELP